MKKTSLIAFVCSILIGTVTVAQSLQEFKNISLYEHHTTGNAYPGGLEGDLSAYSFDEASHKNVFSDDLNSFDMMEFASPETNDSKFGFRNGISNQSSNSKTQYVEVNASDYNVVTDVSDIKTLFDLGTQQGSSDSVYIGKTFVAKIKSTEQYVILKVTDLVIETGANFDIHFIFDYKTGVDNSTGIIEDYTTKTQVYPSLVRGEYVTLEFSSVAVARTIRVFNIQGKVVYFEKDIVTHKKVIDFNSLPDGAFMIVVEGEGDKVETFKVINNRM